MNNGQTQGGSTFLRLIAAFSLVTGLVLSFVLFPMVSLASPNNQANGYQLSVAAQATSTETTTPVGTASPELTASPVVTGTASPELTASPEVTGTPVVTGTVVATETAVITGTAVVTGTTVVETPTAAATMAAETPTAAAVATETPMPTATTPAGGNILPQTGGNSGNDGVGPAILLMGLLLTGLGSAALVASRRRA